MAISITCPDCRRQFSNIKPELAGRKVRCSCGKSLRLPESPPDLRSGRSGPPAPTSKGKRPPPTGALDQARTVDAFELHYSDLEDILSRPGPADPDFDATPASDGSRAPIRSEVQTPKQRKLLLRSPSNPGDLAPSTTGAPNPAERAQGSILKPSEKRTDPNRSSPDQTTAPAPPSSFRLAFFSVLAMISAIAAFGFSIFVVSARLTDAEFVGSKRAHATIHEIAAGQFGLDESSSGVKLGFQILGWLIFILAIGLLLLSVIQMLGAAIQLFLDLRWVRWCDGLMALAAFVGIFLLIGALFLHNAHLQRLQRQVNQISNTVQGEEPPSVRATRAAYQDQADQFLKGLIEIGLAPGMVLFCSMLRLFQRPRAPESALD